MKGRSAGKPPRSPAKPPLSPRLPTIRPKTCMGPSKKSAPLRRIAVLMKELRFRNGHSTRPWLFPVVFLSTFAIVLLSGIPLPLSFQRGPKEAVPGLLRVDAYAEIVNNRSDFAYIPSARVLITTTPKTGSTSLWTWLHRGVTGLPQPNCSTYIQDFPAPCWGGAVLHPAHLTRLQRWRALHGPGVLRVAVVRDPFARLLSAWKSKAACDTDEYGTDVHDRVIIVPKTLAQAGLRNDTSCLSLGRFARVLEMLRQRALRGEFNIRDMDRHFRPQQAYFDAVAYDVVLDTEALSSSGLRRVAERLRFRDRLEDDVGRLHGSGEVPVVLSEETARLLHRFAMLTEPRPAEHGVYL